MAATTNTAKNASFALSFRIVFAIVGLLFFNLVTTCSAQAATMHIEGTGGIFSVPEMDFTVLSFDFLSSREVDMDPTSGGGTPDQLTIEKIALTVPMGGEVVPLISLHAQGYVIPTVTLKFELENDMKIVLSDVVITKLDINPRLSKKPGTIEIELVTGVIEFQHPLGSPPSFAFNTYGQPVRTRNLRASGNEKK